MLQKLEENTIFNSTNTITFEHFTDVGKMIKMPKGVEK